MNLTVPEARLLSLLGGECLHRLEVKVVVQVKVVEVLAVYEQIQHVVTLPADLQPSLHPVQRCRLEELRRLERAEEVPGDSGVLIRSRDQSVFYDIIMHLVSKPLRSITFNFQVCNFVNITRFWRAKT